MKIHHSSGMTLVELMLYIGIFSIIFSGFIIFAFEFSRTISVSIGREDGERVGVIVGEFVRWKVHHAESIITPNEGATSTSLQLGDGTNIREDNVVRLFRFDQYIKLTNVYFHKEKQLTVSFTLNNKIYQSIVDLL